MRVVYSYGLVRKPRELPPRLVIKRRVVWQNYPSLIVHCWVGDFEKLLWIN